MTTKTLTFVRPVATVEFYKVPTTVAEHVKATYSNSPVLKMTSVGGMLSADGLTYTQTLEFVDAAAAAEYDADPIIVAHIAARDEYCTANGISSTVA
jgi:hypothetical protein